MQQIFHALTVLSLLLASIALAISFQNDSSAIRFQVDDGYIPVVQNGKLTNSAIQQTDTILTSTKTLQVPDQSVLIGGVTLTNGGTSLVSTASGSTVNQYFVVSDLNESGSTDAFQWKFGPVTEADSIVQPNIVQVTTDGIFKFSITPISNQLFTRVLYRCDRDIGPVNYTIEIGNENNTPIYDYFRSYGSFLNFTQGDNEINFGNPVFFPTSETLTFRITSQSGENFGIFGDVLPLTGQFFPYTPNARRDATLVTFTDTETTVTSALSQFDLFVKSSADPTVATGSSLFPFADIQSAIDAANAGDTIFVDGVFEPTTTPINVNKSVSLVGTQGSPTVIQFPNFAPTNGTLMTCNTPQTTVSLFNIRFQNAQYGINCENIFLLRLLNVSFFTCGWNNTGANIQTVASGSNIGYDSSEAEKLTFGTSDNVLEDAAGLLCNNVTTLSIDSCSFFYNNVGFQATDCTNISLRNSTFVDHLKHSVFLNSSTNDASGGCDLASIRDCGILGCGDTAIRVIGGYDMSIYDCFIRNSWGPAVDMNNVSDMVLAGNNCNTVNMTLFSVYGVPVVDATFVLSGNTIRTTPTPATYVLECIDNVFNANTSIPVDRQGILISGIAQIGDIEDTFVNISNNTFKSYFNCIRLGVNSINNELGSRESRIVITNNVFSSTSNEIIENDEDGLYYDQPFSNENTLTRALDASIDNSLTSVMITHGDTYNVNQLLAFASDDNTSIVIVENNTNRIQYDQVDPAQVTIQGATPPDQSIVNVVNLLNALFFQSGSSGSPPTLTSATNVVVRIDEPVVYTLTADNLGGVYWTNIPNGLAPNISDLRVLTGSLDTLGTTNAIVTLTNAFGETKATITFDVQNAPYLNTKSVYFRRAGRGVVSTTVDNNFPLYRLNNLTGTPWTVSCWCFNNNTRRNALIWNYSDRTSALSPYIRCQFRGSSQELRVDYGNNLGRLRFVTTTDVMPRNTWLNVVVTYDGGTTGNSIGSINDYYSRFQIFVNNVKYTSALGNIDTSNILFGYTGGFDSNSTFAVGRSVNRGQGFQGWVDEVALWDRVLSDGEVNSVYNGGDAGVDLENSVGLNDVKVWYTMGDDSAYPNITNRVDNTYDMTMLNKVASDIQNFVAT